MYIILIYMLYSKIKPITLTLIQIGVEVMDYYNIGKRIRIERVKADLTQAGLAEKANITPAFVGQIERGETKLSLETLVNITNALDVSIDFILRESVADNKNSALQELISLVRSRPIKDITMLVDMSKAMFENMDRKD